VVPYPQVYAGMDTAICIGTTAFLEAVTTAPNFNWSPLTGLVRANTLTPAATPQNTTPYIITVTDILGCPKPVSDTVVVTVIPPVPAFAGNDTTIVVNQPLQLNATGGAVYSWSPSTGMTDPNIPNPVVTLGSQYDSITYRVLVSTAEGCSATDDIKVIVFKSTPDIFVPSAFTPNGDGKNDIIRPKVVGMKQYNYFRIYNRAGQMLYSTSTYNQGWDGRMGGQLQPPGAYVYMAQAIDYTGKTVNKKGTVVLIR
jgi:gliding motility-associated-like protein